MEYATVMGWRDGAPVTGGELLQLVSRDGEAVGRALGWAARELRHPMPHPSGEMVRQHVQYVLDSLDGFQRARLPEFDFDQLGILWAKSYRAGYNDAQLPAKV